MKLNKPSLLATPDLDWTVSQYESALNREGLTSGYFPISGLDTKLDACLEKRIPNYFFLKRGGIEELCAGGKAMLPSGDFFPLRVVPRAATGPDFSRTILGSENVLAKFSEAVFRVYPIHEFSVWGAIPIHASAEVSVFLRALLGMWVFPHYCGILSSESASRVESFECSGSGRWTLFFELVGIRRMVLAEKEMLLKAWPKALPTPQWISELNPNDLSQLFVPRALERVLEMGHPLVSRSPKVFESRSEVQFKKFFRENPC